MLRRRLRSTDFAKVELRVAQVVVCERIPKADKLLRLEVDLGYERRQILSGIGRVVYAGRPDRGGASS